MKHAWSYLNGGEWCNQCGTYRSLLRTEFDPVTGADLGKFHTYYEVGQAPRLVPEVQGDFQCPLLPDHYLDSICKWLQIREEWGGRSRSLDSSGFRVDAHHSALLRRILANKPLLPEPAPLSHSYPNYNLIERGWDEPLSVWTMEGLTYHGKPCVVIDQHRWIVLEAPEEDSWIVTYLVTDQAQVQEHRNTGTPAPKGGWRLIPSTSRWHVRRVGSRVALKADGKSEPLGESASDKLWRIDRLPDSPSDSAGALDPLSGSESSILRVL